LAEQTYPISEGIPLAEKGKNPFSAAESEGLEKDVQSLGSGVTVSLGGKVLGRGLHIVGQIVLARLLGPATFGLYAIGWTLVRIAGALAPLGLDQGIIRFAPRFWHSDAPALRGLLVKCLSMAILSGMMLALGLVWASPWLAADVFGKPELTPVLRLFALTFPFLTGLRVAAAATRATRRMKFSAYAEELTQPAANLLLVVAFYLLSWRLLGAVAAAVISFIAAFVLALFYLKRLFPEVLAVSSRSAVRVRELVGFSLASSLGSAFILLIVWMDRLMAGYFLPAAEVGVYQAASQSAVSFAVILGGFNLVFAPMMANLYQKKEAPNRLEELFCVSTKWTLYVCLPFFLVVCFASRALMTAVFGPEYAAGGLALLILASSQMVNAGTGPVGVLLTMSGHPHRWFAISGSMLLVNIILNLLWIPRWGIMGAALASACAVSGLSLLGLWQVKRLLLIWPYDRRHRKELFAAGTTAAVLWFVRPGGPDPLPFGVFSLVPLSVMVFVGTLVLLGLDGEDWNFFQSLRARFTPAGKGKAV